MQDQQPLQDSASASDQRLHPTTGAALRRLGLVTGFVAVVLAAGSGSVWWTRNSIKPPTLSAPASVPVAPRSQPQPTQSVVSRTVQVYWLKDVDGRLELVATPLMLNHQSNQSDQILTAALNQLLAGPKDDNVASSVPQGTTLRNVTIEPDGIHVDLSPEFKSGGGSAAMTGRLGQIIYTATTLEPSAKVWISVNGKPLRLLGGEGLEIDQPMTRHSFDQNFSL
jgi:spore germination protein GerM